MLENDPEVLSAYVEESTERLASLEAGLLRLERSPEPTEELLNALFRDAHSIKAGANLLNLCALETAAHRLENVLDGLRTRRLRTGPNLCQALLDGVDLLQELVAEPFKPPRADLIQRLSVLTALADSQAY